MGYDVKVNKTKFHRWFSIWNWHRLMATVLFGWGLFDDEEFKRELTIANNLQHHDAPTTPEEEEKYRVKITEMKESDGSKKEPTKGYFITEWQYDVEGRITGGITQAKYPNLEAKKNDEEFIEKLTTSMMASNRMIGHTNDMIFDNKTPLGFKNNACRYMTTIGDGKPLEDMHIPVVLGIGATLGMIRASKESHPEIIGMIVGLFDSFKEQVSAKVYSEDFEPIAGMSLELCSTAEDHTLSFELDEYWDPNDLGSIASFIAIMMDAAYSVSLFEIT